MSIEPLPVRLSSMCAASTSSRAATSTIDFAIVRWCVSGDDIKWLGGGDMTCDGDDIVTSIAVDILRGDETM